jgi:hypothetical protein
MITIDDLDQAVEDLRKLGFDAFHEFVYSPHGCLEGLDVGEEFFPLWELLLPENRADVARADFDAIKARRGSDWIPERPIRRAAEA